MTSDWSDWPSNQPFTAQQDAWFNVRQGRWSLTFARAQIHQYLASNGTQGAMRLADAWAARTWAEPGQEYTGSIGSTTAPGSTVGGVYTVDLANLFGAGIHNLPDNLQQLLVSTSISGLSTGNLLTPVNTVNTSPVVTLDGTFVSHIDIPDWVPDIIEEPIEEALHNLSGEVEFFFDDLIDLFPQIAGILADLWKPGIGIAVESGVEALIHTFSGDSNIERQDMAGKYPPIAMQAFKAASLASSRTVSGQGMGIFAGATGAQAIPEVHWEDIEDDVSHLENANLIISLAKDIIASGAISPPREKGPMEDSTPDGIWLSCNSLYGRWAFGPEPYAKAKKSAPKRTYTRRRNRK